jgi:(S)-ureidoglycine aminohydrolase
LPLEGYPASKLPAWPGVEARILASPALGADFAQYLLHLKADQGTEHTADGEIETFFYVLDGEFTLSGRSGDQRLKTGGFALVSPVDNYGIHSKRDGRLLMLRKAYEPVASLPPPPTIFGHEANVHAEPFLGDKGARLQSLIPDEPAYDMAMNIFTFDPGHNLPYVETHVMEHGLYFLEGKGVYFLDDEWMEVEATDFIWMGPYVPQSFYATGPIPAKYLYYKNVNRDVEL